MIARHRGIVDLLTAEGEQSVESLARAFSVSGMTIRRDLSVLEESGKLTRTWGGATVARPAAILSSFREKENRALRQKRAIGRAASRLVGAGNAVFLDTGTTTLQIARELRSSTDLTVMTCSFPVVSELVGLQGVRLVMLGGTVRADTLEVYGPITERNFSGLKADLAFLGADAIGPNGELMTTTIESARVSELMMQAGRKLVLVADHTKWRAAAPVQYGAISQLHMVMTDAGLDTEDGAKVRGAGVELILAE